MASSSNRKKGIAGRRGATRRRVNLTRRQTSRKPLARAPRATERRIAGLTVSEIKRLHETDYRGFYAFFVLLSNTESMEVMDLIISE